GSVSMAETAATAAHCAAAEEKRRVAMLQQDQSIRAIAANCQSSSDHGSGMPAPRTKPAIAPSNSDAFICTVKNAASCGKSAGSRRAFTEARYTASSSAPG